MHEGLAVPERIARDARRVTAPALFHIQWHDEIFPRDGQLALFDLLGSRDKQLTGYAGTHGETKPTALCIRHWHRAAPVHTRADERASDLAASATSVPRSQSPAEPVRHAPIPSGREIEALCTARRGDRVVRPGGRVMQARVDARRVPGVVGEPLQGGDELGTLARVERGEDLFLVLVGDPAGAG